MRIDDSTRRSYDAHLAGSMDLAAAREIAVNSLGGDLDRFGERRVDHLARVAAAVPREAQVIAWLHDLLERSTDGLAHELLARGLTGIEADALELLTRALPESYKGHTLRIATATGEAGRLARIVKLADLDDHLRYDRMPASAPRYAWARRRIVAAQARRGELAGQGTATQR